MAGSSICRQPPEVGAECLNWARSDLCGGVPGNRYSYRDQVFTGETYLQNEPPIDPSSLTRWRRRLGEAGVEELLVETIEAAKRADVIKPSSIKRVIVDTTVMQKAIAHPTDSRWLERCREHLVAAAAQHGLKLRQNYNREAPRLAGQIGRYAHAKQYKRMRRALRTLRSRVGRVMRDVARQLGSVAAQSRTSLEELIGRAKRILSQKQKDKNKLYALHAPEVECISKGKARTPYEFGVKVSITTTHKEGLVLGGRSMPGNPYDGHTLAEALEQAEILSGVRPQIAVVDRGYRGVAVEGVKIYHPGLRRGITRGLRAVIRRRSAIEPAIGHMKADGKLDRNWLKGAHLGRCDARGTVRRWPQFAHDPQEAAASLPSRPSCPVEPLRLCRGDGMRPSSGKTNCSEPTG
ncbi:hypothetical protein R8510_04745 [Ralstonia chuxiongensis]|nr:hypothetical protein R8510_04745 [Ralstonia chuxiongensis]